MSPRPGPRRPLIAFRLSEQGLAAIDARAAKQGVNRSEQIRLMLAFAQEKMPPNWKPKNSTDRSTEK